MLQLAQASEARPSALAICGMRLGRPMADFMIQRRVSARLGTSPPAQWEGSFGLVPEGTPQRSPKSLLGGAEAGAGRA
jgi:hypothetical protein